MSSEMDATAVVETPDAPVEDAPMNVEANESTPIEGAEAGTAEDEDQFYAPPPDHVTGEVNDLAKLTNLNANTLLQEIKVRYERNVIYTFVSDILIAVNPFQRFPIYGPESMLKYRNQSRSKVSPHVYVIADACYNNLFEMEKNQCVIISGESGAGKTESAKFVINYIIEHCRHRHDNSQGSKMHAVANLEEQILQVNPLLEAFGNAQTTMNDNSSRFGKYTRLYFDQEGHAMGIEINEYLLEKSRVVLQGEHERNFHVFYYLFSDQESRDAHGLTDVGSFNCLGGKLWEDNDDMYEELSDAFDVVGFTDDERTGLKLILASILHLCNVDFESSGEHAVIKDKAALETAAGLLKTSADELEHVLLGFDTVTRGEEIRRLYNKDQAYDCRDALAKALYASMFGYIVQRVNELLSPELQQLQRSRGRPGAAQREAPTYEIGVLDIFGFENFESNSFEQMCINVSHEQLQYFFNQHTFRLELEEYAAEGIDGASISFTDNKPLLDMFLGKPVGIFTLLDEECTFPQATDVSFVQKIDQHFSKEPTYIPAKVSKGFPSFSIQHFADTVEYNAQNMIEKNRDNLATGIVDTMKKSALQIVCDVFNGEILPTGQIRAAKKNTEAARMYRGKEMESPSKATSSATSRKGPSLSSQFKCSLSTLVDRMNMCYPHFIRCIKPNLNQKPKSFVDDMVLTQLGYTGVLEATRIRQEGFSWRPQFAEFVRRYKILAFPVTKLNQVKESEASAIKIVQAAGLKNWKVGKTKLFLKYYHLDELEARVEKFYKDIVRTQCAVRSHIARKRYNVLLERAKLSAAERAEIERKEAEERAILRAEREKELERQRLAKEAAELEYKKAEAETEKARLEAEKIRELHEAEEAKKLAQEERKQAELAREERAKALAAAQEAKLEAEKKEQELAILSKAAEEAKQRVEIAEKEAKRQALERTKSRKKRQVEAEVKEQQARSEMERKALEAESALRASELAAFEAQRLAEQRQSDMMSQQKEKEAKYEEMLKKLEEEAKRAEARAEEQKAAAEEAQRAREAAEESARKAQEERKAEEERLRAEHQADEDERQAADFRRPDFDLHERVKTLLQDKPVLLTSSDIKFTARTASGYLHKLGQFRKAWRHRWFVVDLDDMLLKYYGAENSKKEKAYIPIADVMRVFKPKTSSQAAAKFSKHSNLFMIETLARTYCLEAPTPEAVELWITIIGIFTNPMLQESDL